MMEKIFDICVQLMIHGAHQLGMTYKELNVWLFVIIHPLITLIFIGLTLHYRRKCRR